MRTFVFDITKPYSELLGKLASIDMDASDAVEIISRAVDSLMLNAIEFRSSLISNTVDTARSMNVAIGSSFEKEQDVVSQHWSAEMDFLLSMRSIADAHNQNNASMPGTLRNLAVAGHKVSGWDTMITSSNNIYEVKIIITVMRY